jgi:hypothetical protein
LRDLLLLCLRLLAVLLAGAAFAGLRIAPTRAPVATLLALDLPRSAIDTTAWRDSVRAQLASRTPVLAVVTSDGRTLDGEGAVLRAFVDTVTLPTAGMNGSSLAGALLAARRVSHRLAARADSMSLVIVSAFRDDAATPALRDARATWPGRIALTTVPAAAVSADTSAGWEVRTVFGAPRAADSTFARDGGTLVLWPDSAGDAVTSRTMADSAFAVIARGIAMVTPLRRAVAVPATATAVAWWPDGSAAIGEVPLGRGCVRWVGFATPSGDARLTSAARGVRAVLEAPCGASPPPVLPDSLRTMLIGDGAMASRSVLTADANANASSLAKWLLLAAIGVLLLEHAVRNREPRRLA